MSFPIDTTIPAPSNNPADDQPKMLTNFGNINSVIGVDHLTPSDAQGGYHKWARIKAGSLPIGLSSNLGSIYVKAVTTSASVTSNELFYTPGNTSKEYQLTQTDNNNAHFSTFGNNSGTGSAGWVFVAGGLLLQYGSISTASATTTITFPVPFKDNNRIFSVVITPQSTTDTYRVAVTNLSATGVSFDAVVNSGVNLSRINWMAIGLPK